MNPQGWPEEKKAHLGALWIEKTEDGADRYSTAEMAHILHVTKNAAIGMAHRMGLKRSSPIMPIGQGRNNGRRYIPRAPKTTLPVDGPALLAAVIPPRPKEIRVPTGGPCCWPMGEPGTRAFRYCEDPSLAGKPYCVAHCKVAYVRVHDLRVEARMLR